MHYDTTHALLGDDIPARAARIEKSAAKQRQRNRDAGIADMEPAAHAPIDWFAEVGYHWLLSQIGQSQPDYDWSDELDSESRCDAAKVDYLAARKLDRHRVCDALRAAEVKPIANSDGMQISGDGWNCKITWCDRIPGLKTWAGNQTLAKLWKNRAKLIPPDTDAIDVMTFAAPLTGQSGLDGRMTAIDVGFSLDETSTPIATRAIAELLAVIGLQTIPLTLMPWDGANKIRYDAGGHVWEFSILRVGTHGYREWSRSERVPAPI